MRSIAKLAFGILTVLGIVSEVGAMNIAGVHFAPQLGAIWTGAHL